MSRAGHRIGGVVLALVVAGCHGSGPSGPVAPREPFRGMKVVAGVLGDRAILPGLDSQRGEWAASTGADLSFRGVPDDPKGIEAVDVLVFPGDRLGDLVDRGALLVIPDDALTPAPAATDPGTDPDASASPAAPDPFALKEIVPAYRDLVMRYGEERYALPLGGTALVLAYRREALERPENKAAAQAAGVALEVPKTWEDLDALAKFLHGRDWDGDGAADSGIALAWGDDPEGVGDATFLARAAGLGQHRDQYSFLFDADRMSPRIASPPFVEALGRLVELTKSAPPGAARFDAEGARSAFRSGKAALLIDRAERASGWSRGKPVGVAPLPGSMRVFNPDRKVWEPLTTPNRPAYLPRGGGWLVGVVASSSHRDAAIDLAKYLAGPDVTDRLRADRGFPMLATRGPQLGRGMADPKSAPGVDPRGWSDAVDRTIQAARAVVGLRVPGADGYLADLAKGRAAAADGQPAEAALAGVADAWAARTKALGPSRQVWHYRRSLNRLVTAPEPPPRGQ